ncbi:MAG: Gfo/Idh/MocA family oxidoreductase [Chloroflexota bacterium]
MTIRIAVIGAGVIGRRHIELVMSSNRSTLAAICDPAPDVAKLAQQHAVPYFQQYEELFENMDLDGAIIATPNVLHVPIGIACAKRGIDLLVEKPIADTVEEAIQLVEVAEQANTQLMVGHYRRFNPLVQKARAVIQSGQIGRLVAVNVMWTLQKPDAYYDVTWRTEPGGGPILINLIHDIDTLRYICGEIQQLYALTSSDTRGLTVEDSASISLQMANGVLGTIIVSDATPSPWSYESTTFENPDFAHQAENCYSFMGSRGSLAFPRMELWRYADPQKSGWNYPLTQEQLSVDRSDPLTAQLAHFCRVILREESPVVSGSDGVRTLAATLAVQESARAGRPIRIYEQFG